MFKTGILLKEISYLMNPEFATAEELSKNARSFDFKNMRVIKFNSDLLNNFDLHLIIPRPIMGDKVVKLDSTLLSYDVEETQKFKKLILAKRARLPSSNFRLIDDLDAEPVYGTRNARAVLYFRDIEFSQDDIDYILTLGISILCGFITLAEAIQSIQGLIQNTCEVSIKVQPRTFVIITIEPPLFNML